MESRKVACRKDSRTNHDTRHTALLPFRQTQRPRSKSVPMNCGNLSNAAPQIALYKQPPHRDAAVEAFVRAKFTSQYPGAQVLNIDLDYNTWVQRREPHLCGKRRKYLSITRSITIRTNAAQCCSKFLAGRSARCRNGVVGKGSQGLVAAGMGGSGTFMRCDSIGRAKLLSYGP